MSTVSYLYRRDKNQFFCVVDLHKWRETSRKTQGFASNFVTQIGERKLTDAEERDYKNVWRLQSWRYKNANELLEDEKEICGECEFIKNLELKISAL